MEENGVGYAYVRKNPTWRATLWIRNTHHTYVHMTGFCFCCEHPHGDLSDDVYACYSLCQELPCIFFLTVLPCILGLVKVKLYKL
jgi:hypothetical protein